MEISKPPILELRIQSNADKKAHTPSQVLGTLPRVLRTPPLMLLAGRDFTSSSRSEDSNPELQMVKGRAL